MVNLETIVKYFAQQGTVILLESQSEDHPWSRKSYLAASPKAEISAKDDRILISRDGEDVSQKGNPWVALQKFRKQYGEWIFGYLGYDLKNHLEDLSSQNPDPIDIPDLYFMVPGFLLEFDRVTGQTNILYGDMPGESILREVENFDEQDCELTNLEYQTSRDDYLAIINEAQDRITEGAFYEINLSHQMRGELRGSPLALYHKMKEVGPVPFGAYLQTPDLSACCQSPERFLRKKGSTVFSQPIKGTSERGQNQSSDQKLKHQLSSSQKERAENLMIVDLVRNDLSRIAKNGSVEVPELFGIQSFGTVHQMVSTIRAEAEQNDPVEILKACFPMGSMTGAPKISVMKSIDELENYRRGLYSGAIGYITPDGDFDFNVVIRTAIIQNQNLFYSVGGAITSDSDPRKEWDETRVKARALLETTQLVDKY